ncbi:simple sugar transport system permease protein [Micrococcus flavus]|uniref:Simple sugar transport system permease protein n=1 Tax=Micrococcus flavus TaxID=384602 RepID=A0A7W7L472_9MICC|nr:simple sugar transport system permease protein [Micrococcus flavus]GGK44357.1 ABC transporter permease [Micrococcus flavus]
MSTAAPQPVTPRPAVSGTARTAVRPEAAQPQSVAVRHWSVPILLTVFTLVSLLVFALNAPAETATFRISNPSDAVVLPDLTAPTGPTAWILTAVLAAVTVVAWLLTVRGRRVPGWLAGLFALAFVAAFLVWVVGSANNTTVFLTGLIAGSFTLAVPLIFGSMAGILSERSGVVNIAIEGQLLAGAFLAAVVGSLTGSAWAGLIAAVVAGVLVSWLLAVFSIKYLVNQVIVGVVLNVLVAGLTSFLFSTVLSDNSSTLNSPPRFPQIRIPGLADIPVIGPILFDQTILGYGMYLIVGLLWFGLFRTRWGLRVRAVGEHPKAADTVGIAVNRTRYLSVLLGGAVAGMGGAFFTLVSASSFSKEMTAGQGFIALAAVIFGRWNPIGAFFAALLFGFATNMQYVLAILGTPVPSQFMAMLPYLVTVFAVAGLVGRSRGPAAAGVPYVKE